MANERGVQRGRGVRREEEEEGDLHEGAKARRKAQEFSTKGGKGGKWGERGGGSCCGCLLPIPDCRCRLFGEGEERLGFVELLLL